MLGRAYYGHLMSVTQESAAQPTDHGPSAALVEPTCPLPVAPKSVRTQGTSTASVELPGAPTVSVDAERAALAGAALAVLLHRYGARGEITVAVLAGNPVIRSVLGIEPSPGPWSELLARLRWVDAEAPVPGGVVLRLVCDPAAASDPSDIDRSGADVVMPGAGEPVRFTVTWCTDRIVVSCAAASQVADSQECRRMAGHLRSALRAAIDRPDTDALDTDILTAGEKEDGQALGIPRVTPGPWSGDMITQFRQHCQQRPDAVAVTCGTVQLTYRQLAHRSTVLAERLAERGAGPGSRVALAAARSVELVVGVLAVLACGAAYVPVDPAYPAARRDLLIKDAAPALLLVDRDSRVAGAAGTPVLVIDDLDAPLSGVELPVPGPEDPAYVIYTSGSTGQPKGVEITHRNLVRLFDATQDQLRPGSDDVWTMFHSYGFDFSVWEIWGALRYGGRLVVVPLDVSRDPYAFAALLRSEGVTIVNQTPSAFQQLLPALGTLDGAAVRWMILGGEPARPATMGAWFGSAVARNAVLVNMYGTTETTVHATWRVLTVDDLDDAGSPIGGPLADLGLRIRDDAGRMTPYEIPGELQIRGPGLARRYLGDPAFTDKKFGADDAGVRWYRTGDQVRLGADGELRYVGRTDRQVKIRGHRIELGDVESALRAHPAVEQAVALSLPLECHGGGLAAVVVIRGGVSAGPDLVRFLRDRLPGHMVPRQVRVIDRIPLTANGKLDIGAVLDQWQAASAEPVAGAQLSGPVAALADIWTEILGVRPVAGDTFFGLGGDSLSCVQMFIRARQSGLDFVLQDVFDGRTLTELAGADPSRT